ncbi:hypothetical protein GW17_00044669 [Ensete ventricosum]|nr:hypothetical protein GW17_00044669 [Ensete ventricosum]
MPSSWVWVLDEEEEPSAEVVGLNKEGSRRCRSSTEQRREGRGSTVEGRGAATGEVGEGVDRPIEEGPVVAIGVEDVVTKEVGERNRRRQRRGEEKGDGDQKLEATVAGDLEDFEEVARNDTGRR